MCVCVCGNVMTESADSSSSSRKQFYARLSKQMDRYSEGSYDLYLFTYIQIQCEYAGCSSQQVHLLQTGEVSRSRVVSRSRIVI